MASGREVWEQHAEKWGSNNRECLVSRLRKKCKYRLDAAKMIMMMIKMVLKVLQLGL